MTPLESPLLPHGVRARHVPAGELSMHVLEAGDPAAPLVLLLHGFPELAWSWRHVLPALGRAGYHAVAPDQRGYGRTTGWTAEYEGDLAPFRMANLARDAVLLMHALGHPRAACVVGHDFGASVAGWSALLRPDLFGAVVLMSAPFTGAPGLSPTGAGLGDALDAALADLPRPRKHYQRYYATRPADADMRHAPQGLHAFLRAYYHHKSADWPDNRPYPLAGWTAAEMARLPTYYVMDLAQTMAETVAEHMPTPDQVAACRWLTEAELAVYTAEFARTGFQGGLNWYRCRFEPALLADQQLFAGRTIDLPAMFLAGAQDWGIHQSPGAMERMWTRSFTSMGPPVLVDGAGHWVQQEQPQAVTAALLAFLGRVAPPPRAA
jgi:pimeloyl-ACP methyl ester carboxylesterase